MSVVANKYTDDVDEVTCDRCGHQAEPTEKWGYIEYGNMSTGVLDARKDLCPDCLKALMQFLQTAESES